MVTYTFGRWRVLATLLALAIVSAAIIGPSFCGSLSVPESVDLGLVAPGQVRGSIRIVSRSWRPVTIVSVKSNCGCTVSETRCPTTLRWGEHLDVAVALDATDLAGTVTKYLYVRAEGYPVEWRVAVRAIVDRALKARLVPASIDFDAFGSWELPSVNVRLEYGGRPDYEVDLLEAPTGIACYKTSPKNFTVRITDDLPDGRFTKVVSVNGPDGPVEFRMTGRKYSQPYCREPLLVFRKTRDGPIRHELNIRHAADRAIQVIALQTPFGQAQIEKVEPLLTQGSRVSFFVGNSDSVDAINRGDVVVDLLLDRDHVTVRVPFVVASVAEES